MEDQIRTWTEAPISVTIKFGLRGFDTMLTIRGESGVEVLPKLQGALDWLQKAGAAPTTRGGNGNAGAPLCPTHGTPMKRSQHGSGWYCPQKVADDDGTGKPVYCKQKIK